MTDVDRWMIGAAIAQAVLSAAAVIVAVLINSATVKRLDKDRRREREDERLSQIRALGQAMMALFEAANGVRQLDCVRGERLDPKHRRKLIASGRGVSHRLESAAVKDGGLLVCLTIGEQLLGEAAGALSGLGAPTQQSANEAMLLLDGYARTIADLVEHYNVEVDD